MVELRLCVCVCVCVCGCTTFELHVSLEDGKSLSD